MHEQAAQPVHLGCDTGESPPGAGRDRELALLSHVTAASIACGGHAGDRESMRVMVDGCVRHGCVIGAHPSYPDRDGFGRRPLDLDEEELWDSVGAQIWALHEVCVDAGTAIGFVKPHGALYHACAHDLRFAELLSRITRRLCPGAALVGPSGAAALGLWRSAGQRVLREGFADRVYEQEGVLRSRDLADALILEKGAAADQALRLARGEGVIGRDGRTIPMRVDIVCVHADTPEALPITERVQTSLQDLGLLYERP